MHDLKARELVKYLFFFINTLICQLVSLAQSQEYSQHYSLR